MSDSRIPRIEDKIDQVIEKLGEHDVHLTAIKKDLGEHMRRTALLEEKVVPLWFSYRFILTIVALVAVGASAVTVLGYFHVK